MPKHIEDGNLVGKVQKLITSVTGDGRRSYRYCGSAVNPMIKITNIVALLLLAVLAH